MTRAEAIGAACAAAVVLGAVDARAQAGSLAEVSESLEAMTRRVAPAVVQVFAAGYGPGRGGFETTDLLERRENTGSGVILGGDGYLVTNAHVVAGARHVQVLLPPPERPADRSSILGEAGRLVGARVVGTDPETDLAVLRIEERDLPYLELGDSDELRQGQIVFAFGSPRGLPNSVSMGVVSATARQLGADDPMIYIQTDATINPGNSGGPLVDTAGRVVGINTMIYSESGGSEGIGFAAPSNIVRNVYRQIRDTGRVRRGEIGVHVQTITPLLGQALGLDRHWGAILSDVRPDGPADRAGLRSGDIVLALDGKPMENGRQFDVNLYGKPLGQPVTIEVLRDGAPRIFRVEVTERDDADSRFADLVHHERNLVDELGILAVELDTSIRARLPALRQRTGVLVAARAVNVSPDAGLQPGDVIHAVNGQEVTTLADLQSVLLGLDAGSPLALTVERGGGMLYVAMRRR